VRLRIDRGLRKTHPGLDARLVRLQGVNVAPRSDALETFREALAARMRARYDLASLKDEPHLRAYRDFFWRVGIDPTKIRPASEALLRRVVQGKALPRINTLVDAYNLASMETTIALAAFDGGVLRGDLRMRAARPDERFRGIGMDAPATLRGKEIVIEDAKGLVAVYPYRDADRTKVTLATTDTVFLVCGVPGIPSDDLGDAEAVTVSLVVRFCGGAVGED
jgi:DNA/RNA-binding domain of Phe-tRNA-synthetase-like protein